MQSLFWLNPFLYFHVTNNVWQLDAIKLWQQFVLSWKLSGVIFFRGGLQNLEQLIFVFEKKEELTWKAKPEHSFPRVGRPGDARSHNLLDD